MSEAMRVGEELLRALCVRDYSRVEQLLHPDVRLRGMLPGGPFERTGARETVARFAWWFGSAHRFEIHQATAGEVGDRVHLSLRCRLRPLPTDWNAGWHVVEQQMYATVVDGQVTALDLLCTGYRRTGSGRKAAAA